MRKIFIIVISLCFSVSIVTAQNTAKDLDVLSIPDYFNTYMTEKAIKKIYQDKVSLFEIIKNTISPLAWYVYSDRENNGFYDFPGGTKSGELGLGDPLVVYEVDATKNWLRVGGIIKRENGKFKHDEKGWIHAKYLILSPYAVVTEKSKGPRKGMILTSVNAFDKTDDVMQILENNFYYGTPQTEPPAKAFTTTDRQARKFNFLFVLKEVSGSLLLSKTDNLSKEVSESAINIKGWLPKGKVTDWNHRVCLEPTDNAAIFEAYKGKELYVIDTKDHFETFLAQGSLPNKDWAIRIIELTGKRPFAYQMRMPILPGWDQEDGNQKKVAAIAQMIVKDDENSDGEIVKDNLDRLAKIKQKISDIQERKNKINILFVLDGTLSMDPYGPAISRSIAEFIKIRDSKFSNDNYQFALAVYRHYLDDPAENGNPKYPLFEYFPFTGNVKEIQERLEGVVYDSRNKTLLAESHYYGMINAIEEAKFNPKQTNILVLVGDVGNARKDERGLDKDKVAELLYKNNINLISYQVNYNAKTAYFMFNDDVNYYFNEICTKHISSSPTQYYTSHTYDPVPNSRNTLKLKFNEKVRVKENEEEEEVYPIFGLYKLADKGVKMDPTDFQNSLTSSLDDYISSLSNIERKLTRFKDAEFNSNEYNPDVKNDEEPVVMGPGFEDYLRRQGFSAAEIEMMKRQGEISAQGYLSLTARGLEDPAFIPVIFISKEYKDILSDKLDRIAGGKNLNVPEARKVMKSAIISVVRSIMGDETSVDKIEELTFNDVWMQVLGVPFTANLQLKNMKVRGILDQLTQEQFKDFYLDFAEDVKEFRRWDVTDKYSMWKKSGQTYYWIPLSEVPGCGN